MLFLVHPSATQYNAKKSKPAVGNTLDTDNKQDEQHDDNGCELGLLKANNNLPEKQAFPRPNQTFFNDVYVVYTAKERVDKANTETFIYLLSIN